MFVCNEKKFSALDNYFILLLKIALPFLHKKNFLFPKWFFSLMYVLLKYPSSYPNLQYFSCCYVCLFLISTLVPCDFNPPRFSETWFMYVCHSGYILSLHPLGSMLTTLFKSSGSLTRVCLLLYQLLEDSCQSLPLYVWVCPFLLFTLSPLALLISRLCQLDVRLAPT